MKTYELLISKVLENLQYTNLRTCKKTRTEIRIPTELEMYLLDYVEFLNGQFIELDGHKNNVSRLVTALIMEALNLELDSKGNIVPKDLMYKVDGVKYAIHKKDKLNEKALLTRKYGANEPEKFNHKKMVKEYTKKQSKKSSKRIKQNEKRNG